MARQRLVCSIQNSRISGSGLESASEPLLGCVGARPLDPSREMFHLHLVAVDLLAAELAVDLVQVQTVRAGNVTGGFEDVGAQLLDVACLARIVARSLNAARQLAAPILESGDVVRLPAVQRQADALQFFQGFVGIDSDGRIPLASDAVSLFDQLGLHRFNVFLVKIHFVRGRNSLTSTERRM